MDSGITLRSLGHRGAKPEGGRCLLHLSTSGPWVESDCRKGRDEGTTRTQREQGRDRPDCHLGHKGTWRDGPGMEVFPRRGFSEL